MNFMLHLKHYISNISCKYRTHYFVAACLIMMLLNVKIGFAQNVIEKTQIITDLIVESKYEEAYNTLVKEKTAFLETDNDTIIAIYWRLCGCVFYDLEKYNDCIIAAQKACSYFEKANYKQNGYIESLSDIATAYFYLRDYKNAERFFRKAIVRYQGTDDIENYLPSIYLYLGQIYKNQDDSILVDECFKRTNVGKANQTIGLYNYLELEKALWDRAIKYRKEEKYQEAVDTYSELIAEIEKNIGKNEKYVIAVYGKAITLKVYLQQYDDAQPLFEEILALKDSVISLKNEICGSYCNLAQCLAAKGRYSEIEKLVPVGYAFMKNARCENYPPNTIYRYIGNGAYRTTDYLHAIKYYELYLSPKYIREKGKNYEYVTNQLIVSYILMGEPRKAYKLLINFLKTDENNMRTESPENLATVYHNLGWSLMLLEADKEALKYLNMSKDLQIKLYGNVSEKTQNYINECLEKK